MGNPTILIVDDDADIRDAIADVLLSAGYAVRAAHDGAAALSAMRQWPPGLVLLDLMMPEVDGWRVLYEIQKDPALAEIPVCVVSAYADKAPPSTAGFIKKPVKREELLAVVSKHCGPP